MTTDPIAALWERLLSRQPEEIQPAFDALDDESRQALLAHLKRMAGEDGWHPEQRASAQAALNVLKPPTRKRKRH
jgi:hypothetical protein